MHTAHLANVSKSVTKKCYISQNWGTPLFDNTQLHVCYITYSCWGTHFLYLSNPPSGIPVPIIPWVRPLIIYWKIYHCERRLDSSAQSSLLVAFSKLLLLRSTPIPHHTRFV